jgi:group I intron endonuclease
MIIYKMTNVLTGDVYIGQTIRPLVSRLKGHMKAESLVGQAMRNYGTSVFVVTVIDRALTVGELDEKEKFWIRHFDSRSPNGYNQTDGGDTVRHDRPHTEAAKQKIKAKRATQIITESTKEKMRSWERTEGYKQRLSESQMGHAVSEETKRKISETRIRKGIRHDAETVKRIADARRNKPSNRRGMKASPETRERLRVSHLGKRLSEEAKRKLSNFNKGKKLTEEHKQKLRDRIITDEVRQKYRAAWVIRKQKHERTTEEVAHVSQ